MTKRREFSVACQVAVVNRASDSSWRIHCEKCGIWCKGRKDYEIDHVVPEEMRPDADKAEKLKPADAQLLCLACHAAKTKDDQADIGMARRREAYDMGVEKPAKKKFRRWPPHVRKKRERAPAVGEPALMRRGFVPAGGCK